MPDPTPTKCSNANYNTAYPVLQSKLLWVQLCHLQITAHCPGCSCYDSADCDPVTSHSFSQGLVTEGRMVRALLGCWLPSAPCMEGSCSHSCLDQRKSMPFALLWYLTGWPLSSGSLSFNRKGWTWAGAAEAGTRPRSQGQPSSRYQAVPCNQAGTSSTGLGKPPWDGGAQPPTSIIMLGLCILPARLFHSCQTLCLGLYIREIGRWGFSLSRAE